MSFLGRLFKRADSPAVEKRSALMGPTRQVMIERAAYLMGGGNVAELTSATQACVSLWEHGFALADVEGTNLLDRHTMAMLGRQLALKGEALFLIRDERLVPVSHWDLSTRYGQPRAYRVHISEAGGATGETVLAAEVLHFRIGVDSVQPWVGRSPLARAPLSAELLEAVEAALRDVYRDAPLGSQVVPYPETGEEDLGQLGASFRGRRGRVLMRESVQVSAAGGPAPSQDWKPQDVTPDLSRVAPVEMLAASRNAIMTVYGVLPSLLIEAAQGPLVREAQRHLAQWTLQPLAMLIAEEVSRKLVSTVMIDVLRPIQAYDAGGRARALMGVVEALARAKEAGIDPDLALSLVNWKPGDGIA